MTGNDDRFARRYSVSAGSADLAAEYEALGTDYQASGYTTPEQADALGRLLGLGSGQLLLDLGSGCGWPGLYLADRFGCALVSIEPVLEGCRTTRGRAMVDGLEAGSLVVQAVADSLPLRAMAVDAVVHGDLLC